MKPVEFDEAYAARQISRRGNPLRRWLRAFYLDRVVRFAHGPTVDIGCGAGPLLRRLPAGSIGLEVNPTLVTALRAEGFTVIAAEQDPSRIVLDQVEPHAVQTAVLSHVLEHFDAAADVLKRLFEDCRRLGITRLVVVVPGRVGYDSDATHRTYVTLDYLRSHSLLQGPGRRVVHHSFFPGDHPSIGDLFIYHELMLVYDIDPDANAVAAPATDLVDATSGFRAAQFVRFVLVGIVNTGFSFGLYALLVFAGLHYVVANLVSLVISILFSFKMQGTFVFGNRDYRPLVRFVATWAVIYCVNVLLIGRFIALGLDPYSSGALALPFTIVLSFLAQKFFVFRPRATNP